MEDHGPKRPPETARERAEAAHARAILAGQRAAELRAGSVGTAETVQAAAVEARRARQRANESRTRAADAHEQAARLLADQANTDPAHAEEHRAAAARHRDAARHDREPRGSGQDASAG